MFQTIRENLREATFNVLETMFFAVPEHFDGAGDGQWDVEGVIRLTAAQKLTVFLLLPKNLGISLASNFLGIEPEEVSKDQLLDLMREMTNMVGGNLVTRLGDETIALGLPESRLAPLSDKSSLDPANQVTLRLEEYLMTIMWSLES
jgi:CheY-specific phosphatase CheX